MEPNGKIEDEFLNDLESAVRKILKSPKRKSEHLSAINAGVKLAAIRHKISGGEDDKGFFSK
jgi:spore germination protein GerM